MSWTWTMLDESNALIDTPEALAGDDLVFHSQADAETWVGEIWAELLEEGVHAVTLVNDGRKVYGPMSLHPADQV